jgi:hypothetical protein
MSEIRSDFRHLTSNFKISKGKETMKKCPTCDKEYPDSMRFCQTDGTVLVEAAPPADLYKTIVSNQNDISSAIPPPPDQFQTMVAPKNSDDDDLLQLPAEPDLLKTMVVSRDELKAASDSGKAEDVAPLDLPPPAPYTPSAPLIEPKPKAQSDSIPPKPFEPLPTPPSFEDLPAPKLDAPKPEGNASTDATAIFNEPSMPENPPSPFDSKPFENDFSKDSPYGSQENKPIPSPFDLSMPPGYMPPSMSPFENEPKSPPVKDFSAPSPFDAPTPFGQPDPFNNQPLQQSEWTPPPAPDANWQNENIGANTPFQPPVAGQGLNQTLPIISLVLGILSLCCYVSPLTGLAALITGYLGMKNVNTDPNQYGGKTLAIVGMALGGVFFIVGVLYYILIVILGVAGSFGR